MQHKNKKLTEKRRVICIQSNKYWTPHVTSDVLSK